MSREYGTVISTLEGPSTRVFSFLVNPEQRVHRGQFIQIETEAGKLIGRVADVRKTNRYYMRPESVKEFEKSGKAMGEIFPTTEWEYLVADVNALGVLSDGLFKEASFPVSPGDSVLEPENRALERFFGLDLQGIRLGSIPYHSVEARLDMTRLFQKHMAILALSGGGKSYLAGVLIEELLNRKPEQGQLAAVIIDPHGEYPSFADDGRYSAKTRVFPSSDIRIGVSNLSGYTLCRFMPRLSPAQVRELDRVIRELRRGRKGYSLSDLIEALEARDMKSQVRDILVSVLTELAMTGIFGASDYPPLEELARQGGLSVIDLSEEIGLRKKQIIVAYLAGKLFEARRNGIIPPFLLVLEEAHQFCLSEDTEIFTVKGWKKYTDTKIGDLAFSYNKDTNKLEANPIERILIRNHKGKMVKLYNEDSIDSLVTDDHRVLCDTRTTGKDKRWKWSKCRFIPAKNLPSGMRIPVAAKINSNSKCNIDDDLIKILGWIITDGTLHCYNKKYSYYEVYQSKAKDKILEEMKEVIKCRFPDSSIYFRKKGEHSYSGRIIPGAEEFTFYLGNDATKEIQPWLGNYPHRIPRKFLEKASLRQLKILFDALVQGDGHIQHTKNNHKYVMFYAGHNFALADDFQELCIRLGFSAIAKTVPSNKQTKVLVSFKRRFAYVRKATKKYFSGKVWDITIKYGAFVARRNGKVFITGNCPEKAVAEQAISRPIITQIAREGRKFHASLCLISQRPKYLATTALAQCNTHFILRVSNPYDLDHIRSSSEGITEDVLKRISSLRVGSGMVVGEAVNFPLFIDIRKRESRESGKGMPLQDAAVEWQKRMKQSKKDAKAFM